VLDTIPSHPAEPPDWLLAEEDLTPEIDRGPLAGWLDRDPIAYHAGTRPGRIACIEAASGQRLTYADLHERVARAAGWLSAAFGIGQGERVAFLGRSSIDQLAVMFACHRLGAVFQPLNWRLPGAELAFPVEDATPRVLIFDPEFGEAANEVVGGGSNTATFSAGHLAGAISAAEPTSAAAVDPDAPFILLYTSGTTGRPKGAIITRSNAFFSALNFMTVGQVTSASTMLCDAPLFHTVGAMAVARTSMQAGAAMVISDRFLPERTLALLSDKDLGVTHYFAVPQIAQMLRDHPSYTTSDLTGLTALFTGGAPMPPTLIEAFLDDGVTLANGYGMTEAGTVLGMPLDKNLIRRRLESAGLPAPTARLRIVRADGTDAKTGEPGEIWIKGPGVMPGYWNRPEENERAFVDGWFRSGDAAVMDEDGYFRLIDRWKDMYISGGENVYPAEVETVLATAPGVLEVAVVGVPDARWGESGCAFVVAAPGASVTAETVIGVCAGRLARYKAPRSVQFVDALPRTASGKVRKDLLRALNAEKVG
jgi:fatty-acyl-CoA synthase